MEWIPTTFLVTISVSEKIPSSRRKEWATLGVAQKAAHFWKPCNFIQNGKSASDMLLGIPWGKKENGPVWPKSNGPKWPIFLFYPKGLPTSCLMQIYHLGLNCRVSKNRPPFWAKVAHFPFLPQGPPNNMSDADLPFGVKLQGFQKWATLLGQSGPFSFFTPRVSQQHV